MLSFAAIKPRGVKHVFDDFHFWSGINGDGDGGVCLACSGVVIGLCWVLGVGCWARELSVG